jgi:hypothetical protein
MYEADHLAEPPESVSVTPSVSSPMNAATQADAQLVPFSRRSSRPRLNRDPGSGPLTPASPGRRSSGPDRRSCRETPILPGVARLGRLLGRQHGLSPFLKDLARRNGTTEPYGTWEIREVHLRHGFLRVGRFRENQGGGGEWSSATQGSGVSAISRRASLRAEFRSLSQGGTISMYRRTSSGEPITVRNSDGGSWHFGATDPATSRPSCQRRDPFGQAAITAPSSGCRRLLPAAPDPAVQVSAQLVSPGGDPINSISTSVQTCGA